MKAFENVDKAVSTAKTCESNNVQKADGKGALAGRTVQKAETSKNISLAKAAMVGAVLFTVGMAYKYSDRFNFGVGIGKGASKTGNGSQTLFGEMNLTRQNVTEIGGNHRVGNNSLNRDVDLASSTTESRLNRTDDIDIRILSLTPMTARPSVNFSALLEPIISFVSSFFQTRDPNCYERVDHIILPSGYVFRGCLASREASGYFSAGYGVGILRDGDQYEGSWDYNRPHGKGRFTYGCGATYVGEVFYGKRDGQGNYTKPDGTTYTGSWYLDKKQGFGIETSSDGTTYTGSWRLGRKDSFGIETSSDNCRFEGDFLDNKYLKGNLTCPNKNLSGFWNRDNEFTGNGTVKDKNDCVSEVTVNYRQKKIIKSSCPHLEGMETYEG